MCENHSTIWPILKYFLTGKYINLKFLTSTTKIYLYMLCLYICACLAYVLASTRALRIYLAGMHLLAVHLAGVHLLAMHLLGIHLLAMHLPVIHLLACLSWSSWPP